MLSNWLNVPHFPQENDFTCLQACVRMSLAYHQYHTTETDISQLFNSNKISTPISQVKKLHQWGYDVFYGSVDMAQLRQWLAEGVVPIVCLQTEFLGYWQVITHHTAVIIGIDKTHVYLNDPAFHVVPQIASLDNFQIGWQKMDRIAIAISIPC
ncbi:MAG: hypothetical protein B6242_02355 [Anaerolineaceae bacterium 4572_78]|nr:MAG: hypothetical protein B6242_02355 [Anaerolineaceae bacterium 4572_78]